MQYNSAFDLLDIQGPSGRGLGGRAPRSVEGDQLTTRGIYDHKREKETRKRYEADMRQANEKAGIDPNEYPQWNSLTDLQKIFYQAKYEEQTKKDHDDKVHGISAKYLKQDKEARQKKEDMRRAMRDYVAEQKAKGRDYNDDGRWTHADTEKAREEFKAKQKEDAAAAEVPKEDNETGSGQTSERAAEKEAEGLEDASVSLEAQLVQLRKEFDAHATNATIHKSNLYGT